MKQQLQPIGDRVIIEPILPQLKTESGIILKEEIQNQEKPGMGKIIAIGNLIFTEGKFEQKLDISVGDTVIYAKYVGETIEWEGKQLIVIRNESILAKVINEK